MIRTLHLIYLQVKKTPSFLDALGPSGTQLRYEAPECFGNCKKPRWAWRKVCGRNSRGTWIPKKTTCRHRLKRRTKTAQDGFFWDWTLWCFHDMFIHVHTFSYIFMHYFPPKWHDDCHLSALWIQFFFTLEQSRGKQLLLGADLVGSILGRWQAPQTMRMTIPTWMPINK